MNIEIIKKLIECNDVYIKLQEGFVTKEKITAIQINLESNDIELYGAKGFVYKSAQIIDKNEARKFIKNQFENEMERMIKTIILDNKEISKKEQIDIFAEIINNRIKECMFNEEN